MPVKPGRGWHRRQRLTRDQITASNRLRMRALASGMSRADLAKAAGISEGHASKWLSETFILMPEAQARLIAAHPELNQ